MSDEMLILAVVLLLTIIVARYRGRLTPFMLTLLTLIPIVGGHGALDEVLPTASTGPEFVASLAFLVLGYLTQPSPWPERQSDVQPTDDGELASTNHRASLLALACIGLLTTYHFIRVGLPVFSQTVETDRFNFSGSGLLGLPGRAFLFGVPLVVVSTAFVKRRWPGTPGSSLALGVAVGVLLFSRLASGFKSALLESLTVVFFAAASTGRGLSISDALRRYVGLAVIALLFALQLSQSYATLAGLNREGAMEALVQRATSQAALPGHLVMQPDPPLALHPTNTLVNDSSYFFARYSGLQYSERFSFNQIVASAIFEVPLGGIPIAPVTIGAFPQLLYDFDILAYPIMFLLGIAYARLERSAVTAGALPNHILAMGGVFILQDYLTKGNLVYVTINWGAMVLLVLLLVASRHRLQALDRPTMVHLTRIYSKEENSAG